MRSMLRCLSQCVCSLVLLFLLFGLLFGLLALPGHRNPAQAQETPIGSNPENRPVLPPPPPPVECIDPTAHSTGESCGPNRDEIRRYTASDETRCIDAPPDLSAGFPSDYIADCSANDLDSCRPCVWKAHTCPPDAPYRYNRECNFCPQETPFYWSNGTCHSCPNGQVLSFGACCPLGQTYENGACRAPCPTATPYRYPDGSCQSCPVGQVWRPSLNACGAACELYSITANIKNNGAQDDYADAHYIDDTLKASGGLTLTVNGAYSSVTTNLSCLTNLLNAAIASTALDSPRYFDDRLFTYFLGERGGPALFADPAKLSGCVKKTADSGHYVGNCVSGTAYLDQNCNQITPAQAVAECGNLRGDIRFSWAQSSPISLDWHLSGDIERETSIVSFPINPAEPGKWWLWKASSKKPLVVFDPTHQGVITSASQLFGNWTFGGRQVAALVDRGAGLPQPWDNGYEALRTLDSNLDGRVAGSELSSLGLWFDANQDGVSQPGEVKSMDASGVTALFFNADKSDPVTKNVSASVGFERTVDGKVSIGSSVDWYSQGADFPFALYAQRALGKELDKKATATSDVRAEDTAAEAAATSVLTGAWKFQLSGKELADKRDQDGLLLFKELAGGKIEGSSLFEIPVNSGSKNFGSMLHMTQLTGTIGRGEVRFNMKHEAGDEISSRATIDAGGKTMNGTTVYSTKDETGVKTLTYRWKATKIARKQ